MRYSVATTLHVSEEQPVHISGGSRRATRALGVGLLLTALTVGLAQGPSSADEPVVPEESAATDGGAADEGRVTPQAAPDGAQYPYGSTRPPMLEANFARPLRSISSSANSDFSQLDDLERIIKGSWYDFEDGRSKASADIKNARVYLSISRMENSKRVGRALLEAARKGVTVRVIHGKASQSKESRYLQSQLNKTRTGAFKICAKGRSLACLSSMRGGIMHSKVLIVNQTFTRDGDPATGAVWSGSANLGGPSGERTWNNGWTVYNDKKIYEQSLDFWADMWAERSVNNDYLTYIKARASSSRYGITAAEQQQGSYTSAYAKNGMFYSNLTDSTYYLTPIRATPSNGKDPVLNLLNRIRPDEKCRIRLQHNRFKYRRLAVAEKLVQLSNAGCQVELVAFRDDLAVNRRLNCQQWLRVCRPILDELRNADRKIEAAWAKPHDKPMLVAAVLGPNKLNPEEILPTQQPGDSWPSTGARVKVVQAGSASLTGSNLVASDEITTETTNLAVYNQYLEHWRLINRSYEFKRYPY